MDESPLTPFRRFRLDLAYGQETSKFRVHFSIGVAF